MNEIIVKDLNEKIYSTKLDNGLNVYMWVKETVHSFYATYSVRYGSLHTNFKIGKNIYKSPAGIAHFIEHLKFNIGPDETAFDLFAKTGIDANAFTTFKFTNYQVMGTEEPVKTVLNLIDFVQNPYFTKKLVEKEKGIIVNEAYIGLDDPYMIAMYGLLKNVFKREELSKLITGTPEDIKSTTLEDVKIAYESFYHPENSNLIITGNFNPYEMLAAIKENQSKKEFGEFKNPKIIKKIEPKKVMKKYEEIEANVKTGKIKLGIKIPIPECSGEELFKILCYYRLLFNANFGDTSDFKNDIIDNGLATSVYHSVGLHDDILLFSVQIDSNYKEEILNRLYKKIDNLDIDEKTFKRVINADIALCVLNYEDIVAINEVMQLELINYNKILPNQKEILENMKYSELKDFIANADLSNISVIVLNPINK